MSDPIPADALYDLTEIKAVELSPEGERLAFVAEEFDPVDERRRSSLFVVPTDGSCEPYRLTRLGGVRAPKWTDNGRRLGFLADRPDDLSRRVGRDPSFEGDDTNDTNTQLWAFDFKRGGDARQLTDINEGVSEFDWAPDGERAVVVARDPTDEQRTYLDQRANGGPIESERLQHKFDGHGWLDNVRTYLFVVGPNDEIRRLDDTHGAGAAEPMVGRQPAWSPGERIAFLTNHADRPDDTFGLEIHTIAADGTDRRRIADDDLMPWGLTWNSTGECLAFVGQDPTNWFNPSEVYITSADGDRRSISESLDRTIPETGTPRWIGTDELLVPIGDQGTTRLVILSTDGTAQRTFDYQGIERSIPMVDTQGGIVACMLSDPRSGVDLYALSATDLNSSPDDPIPWQRLTSVNGALLERYNRPEFHRTFIRGREDGSNEIEAMVYTPVGFDPDEPIPHPLLLSIHGGPQWYDGPRFEFENGYWTSRGYVVLRVNYRGSTSYGRAFAESLRGKWGDLDITDLLGGVEAMIERRWVNPDQVFATGFSYGGIATARLLQHSDRFTAGAAEHGVYDRRSTFGTDDAHVWWTNQYGLPWTDEAVYNEGSTVARADDIETPLLLTAGGEDWRCPPTQAEQLYVSLKKIGTLAKLVIYPDEHHNVGAPDRAVHRLRLLAEWFERHGGPPASG